MVYHQNYYLAAKVNSIITKYKSIQNEIILYWLNHLLQYSVIEAAFDNAGVILPAELVPKTL